MDKELDLLLDDAGFDVPAGFGQRVMCALAAMPAPARRPGPGARLQQLALLAGGLLGVVELASFMFGIWAATAAG